MSELDKLLLDENGDQYQWMIAEGDLVCGHTFYGPFKSTSEALDWNDFIGQTGILMKLYRPDATTEGQG